MRAAYYEQNGPATDVLRVGEVEAPSPGPGEVRIKLHTSGINPSDVKGRAGLTRKIAFPRVIPHSDGAGEIDMIGDGVAQARLDERVWTFNAQWRRPFGTAAEYVVLPAKQAVALPDAGATVFVPAGAGAVGNYAIQFAKARQAQVITSVSSETKAALARQAGADHIINYKNEDLPQRIGELTGGRGVDAILEVDLGAGAKYWPRILRPHGAVVVYGTSAPEHVIPAGFCLTNNIRIRFILVYEMSAAEIDSAVAAITKMLTEGRLVHNIALTLPLEQIVKAHEAVEHGAGGKVVLQVT